MGGEWDSERDRSGQTGTWALEPEHGILALMPGLHPNVPS